MSHLPASDLFWLLWAAPSWLVVTTVVARGLEKATGVPVLEDPPPSHSPEELEILLLAAAGRLWRRVSHEANNSLSSVMGNSEIGLLSKQPDRMARGLEASGRAARELRQIFVSLSDLSAGTGEVTSVRESIREVFRPVRTLLERSLEKAGIRLEEPEGDLPVAGFDRRKLSMALAALTARLIDEMRANGGGEMRLSAVEGDGRITIGLEARHADPVDEAVSADVSPAGIEERLAAAVCTEHGGELGIERAAGSTRYRLHISNSRPAQDRADIGR